MALKGIDFEAWGENCCTALKAEQWNHHTTAVPKITIIESSLIFRCAWHVSYYALIFSVSIAIWWYRLNKIFPVDSMKWIEQFKLASATYQLCLGVKLQDLYKCGMSTGSRCPFSVTWRLCEKAGNDEQVSSMECRRTWTSVLVGLAHWQEIARMKSTTWI